MSESAETAEKKVKKGTKARFDARFPNQNQTRYCNQNYIDYHRCRKIKGEDYEPCEYFHHVIRAACFDTDLKKWDEQRENGIFPVKI